MTRFLSPPPCGFPTNAPYRPATKRPEPTWTREQFAAHLFDFPPAETYRQSACREIPPEGAPFSSVTKIPRLNVTPPATMQDGATHFGTFGMAERYNEGKAIDAVLRRIEVREALSRLDDGWSPDDQQDPDEDRRVDYVCTVGRQLYAFEHTGIAPFDNQIEMEIHNRNLFAPVMTRFDSAALVGEHWQLHTPVEASVGLKGAKIKQVQTSLIAWIQANATMLPVTRFGDRYPYSAQRESAPGVPFRFALYRWSVPQRSLGAYFGGVNSFRAIWRRHGERASREYATTNSASSRSGIATKVRTASLSWRKTTYLLPIINLSLRR